MFTKCGISFWSSKMAAAAIVDVGHFYFFDVADVLNTYYVIIMGNFNWKVVEEREEEVLSSDLARGLKMIILYT